MPAVLPGTDSAVEVRIRTSNKCHEEQQGHVTDLMTLAQRFVGTVLRSVKKKRKRKSYLHNAMDSSFNPGLSFCSSVARVPDRRLECHGFISHSGIRFIH